MAGTASFGFWQPRRAVRVLDSTTRCRPTRMSTSAILNPPQTSVNFEVETFKIYGKLRRTTTEIHNSLPTCDTIQTEKTLMNFDEQRRTTPDCANYDDFYRSLSLMTPLPSRTGTARSGGPSARSVESRQTTLFSLSPSVAGSTATRPLESRQSAYSRLGTSYNLRPSDSRQTDRVSVSLRLSDSRQSDRVSLVAGHRSLSSRPQTRSDAGKLAASVLEATSEPSTKRVVVESGHQYPCQPREYED